MPQYMRSGGNVDGPHRHHLVNGFAGIPQRNLVSQNHEKLAINSSAIVGHDNAE